MLKFEYRVGPPMQHLSFRDIEEWLNAEGARGFRLSQVVNNTILVLERITEDAVDEQSPPRSEPSVGRPVDGALVEFLCGCGCGEVGMLPEVVVPVMQAKKLIPYVRGHGPQPEEPGSYLAPAAKSPQHHHGRTSGCTWSAR